MESIRLEISGEIQKENGDKFTEKEKYDLIDNFLVFIESKGCLFIGSVGS